MYFLVKWSVRHLYGLALIVCGKFIETENITTIVPKNEIFGMFEHKRILNVLDIGENGITYKLNIK